MDLKLDLSFALYGDSVTDFSSQYGHETSISYTAQNLIGEPAVFPHYGDFTRTCVFRTYGRWWKICPSAAKPFGRNQSFANKDFIEIQFSHSLLPDKLEIFETYNSGAIVRILACDTDPQEVETTVDRVKWFVLWEAEGPRMIDQSRRLKLATKEGGDGVLRRCPFKTCLIRLELDPSISDYYPELDAVILVGECPDLLRPVPQYGEDDESSAVGCVDNEVSSQKEDEVGCQSISNNNLLDASKTVTSSKVCDNRLAANFSRLHFQDGITAALTANGLFDTLPNEVIQYILQFLDYRSLSRLGRVCRFFESQCSDSSQYVLVNLQPWWHKVNDATLESFSSKCSQLRKLNLSWCGSHNLISRDSFNSFLHQTGERLTTLHLASCKFISDACLQAVADYCPVLEDLNLASCTNVTNVRALCRMSGDDSPSSPLRRLNLYRTKVDEGSICDLIRICPNLQHLNLGSCVNIDDFNNVVEQLATYCRKLESLDVWRARTLTDVGIFALCEGCSELQELELGWCLKLSSSSGCLLHLSEKCPKLQKLFLASIRSVCDRDVRAFAQNLPHLQQFDILGTRQVSHDCLHLLLQRCKKLIFVDISFCASISDEVVNQWKLIYPNVNFKRSFQRAD